MDAQSDLMRILALGDIHGCSIALRTLLDAVQPGSDDLLITLGDYVDRGPDSKGVLDILLGLEKTTQLKPLIGNHEVLLMDAMAGQVDVEAWLRVGGHETLQSYAPEAGALSWKHIVPEHMEFLTQRCLRHWETENHLFVHANANAVFPLSEQTDDWLFWTRFEDSYPHVSGKTMICGHTAQRTGRPALRPHAVCLDTWAYGDGWLTCMDVDTGEFTQANQAGQLKKLTLDDLDCDTTTSRL